MHSKTGFKLVTTYKTVENDVSLATSNDYLAMFFRFTETQFSVTVDSQVGSVVEVSSELLVKPLEIESVNDPPGKFIRLSTQGKVVVKKLRPIGNEDLCTKTIDYYSMEHKKSQIYTMHIMLLCSESLQDGKLAEWTTRFLFMHGGHYTYSKIGEVHLCPIENLSCPDNLISTI